jgi:hypothetical protein
LTNLYPVIRDQAHNVLRGKPVAVVGDAGQRGRLAEIITVLAAARLPHRAA